MILLVAAAVLSGFALFGVGTPAYGVPTPHGLPHGSLVPAASPSADAAAPFTGGWMESIASGHTSYTPVYDISARPNNGGVVVSYTMTANSGGLIIFSLGPGQALTTGVEYSQANGDGIQMGTCPEGSFELDALGQPGADGTFSAFGIEFSAECHGALITGEMALDLPGDVGQGYYLYQQDGALYGFGNDQYLTYLGNLAALTLNGPVVAMATTPDGGGYWMVGSDGGIFAFGDAQFYGSMGGKPLNKPIVGIVATPDGQGYWEVASDGGIFAFGDAQFYGSTGGMTLNRPIVGMAATPTGQGYWEVASDGGIFAFGDAQFSGSLAGAATPTTAVVAGIADR